jgi:hypothetical protein
MTLAHNLFDSIATTITTLEFIHIYRREGEFKGKRWVILCLIGLVASFGGMAIYDDIEHQFAVKAVERGVTDILNTPRTFDELFHGVAHEAAPLVPEAVANLLSKGTIIYDDIVLAQQDNSAQHEVRLYRNKTTSQNLSAKGDL